MAGHIMSAAAGLDSLQDAQDRIAGIQQAATILMQRLYRKDPRKWVQIAMMSPAEIIPWPEQPDNTQLGVQIGAWLQKNPRAATIRMSRDGVAEILRPVNGGVAIISDSLKTTP